MYTITEPLTLEQAMAEAKKLANETGKEVTIYSMTEHEKVAPPYIKGAWYYGENFGHTWICRFSNIDKEWFNVSECVYQSGLYIINDSCCAVYIKGLATPEQIEAHLKSAAHAKGFVEGVEVIDVYGDRGLIDRIFAKQDCVWSDRRGNLLCLYNGGGKWAKLSGKEEAQPELLTITYTNDKGERITVQGTNVEVK